MSKNIVFFVLSAMACFCANAEYLDLDSALRATYTNCVGIDDALHDMKVKAGISTAVTGVGTGLGIGAVATGIAKANLDSKYAQLSDSAYSASSDTQVADREDWAQTYKQQKKGKKRNTATKETKSNKEIKSKKLGNWRTGLLAGNTATNIAGAAISGTNKVDQTLQEQIDACRASVKDLKNSITRAKFDGEDVNEAQEIASACEGFEYVDTSKINNRATGGMASSIVGAGTGFVGTITSALANSNKVRKDDSVKGQQKEKTLNASANVLAAGSTVASAAATVFNATQIKAIKDVSEVASKCTEVLK